MKRHKAQKKKWLIAMLLMLYVALVGCFFLRFDNVLTLSVTLIEGIVLLSMGERLNKQIKEETMTSLDLMWEIVTIMIIVGSISLIEQGTYITQESYTTWLLQVISHGLKSIEFEVGTMMWICYIIFLGFYGNTIWKIAKKNINEWIPSFWCLIIGIGITLYTKEGCDHNVRIITLAICEVSLVGYVLIRYFVNREQKVVYYIGVKRYLILFVTSLVVVIGIGNCIPECQVLPGTRWIRQLASYFSGSMNLQDKIPFQTRLTDDIALSDSVLFEVNASEPLYLRSLAYSQYEDGVWSIPKQNESIDMYIDFKPQYLEAEYSQTESLLDEIAYQNSQNESILPQYAEIANYEGNVSHKKQYTILQNPINEINYFTVNGLTKITDEASSSVYYFDNINECYFHGEKLVEPSQYTVEYYDHVPKIGSREYMFLRNMNANTWQNVYQQVIANRTRYSYDYDGLPKLLLTYTPMVQFKNAKKNFLQVPNDLREPLRALTKQMTLSQNSDWSNADAICNYLKHHYTYKLTSKKQEGDHIYEFLFEDKEGICQEFATSMVLMCRSIGIPAKYVTGYLVSEKNNETGRYVVREKDAHAFVEAYIAGYGWMSFDPTPAVVTEETKDEEKVSLSVIDYMRLLCIAVAIILVVGVSRGGLGFFEEKWWQLTLRFYKPNKQMERIMMRSCMWLARMQLPREPYETLSQYAARMKEKEVDIIWMVKQYENYKYGEMEINPSDIKTAYRYYKMLKVKLKNK